MFISFIISFVTAAVFTLLCMLTTGGLSSFPSDPILIGGMLLCVLPMLFASGYLKDFGKAFVIGNFKWKTVPLVQLQNSYEAVRLVVRTELYLGLFLSFASFTAVIYNWDNKQYVGPNMYSLLASLLNAFLFSMVLLPMETALKRRIFSYMDEGEAGEAALEEANGTTGEKKARHHTAVFYPVFIVLFVMFFIVFWSNSLRNDARIPIAFNLPVVLFLVIAVVGALLSSGSMRDFGSAFRIKDKTKRGSLPESNKICEAVDLVIKTLLVSAGSLTMTGCIAILISLADSASLVPNTYVAILPIMYGAVFALMLLPVRAHAKRRTVDGL